MEHSYRRPIANATFVVILSGRNIPVGYFCSRTRPLREDKEMIDFFDHISSRALLLMQIFLLNICAGRAPLRGGIYEKMVVHLPRDPAYGTILRDGSTAQNTTPWYFAPLRMTRGGESSAI